MQLYFAYGSNLLFSRMRDRVPSARLLERARLPGVRLVFDKRGRDGSGKANLREAHGSSVWGVLYAIEPAGWEALDRHEGGYARVAVEAVGEEGELHAAATYVAQVFTADAVPFDWYQKLVIEGAREHGLPPAYLAALESVPRRPDPRRVS